MLMVLLMANDCAVQVWQVRCAQLLLAIRSARQYPLFSVLGVAGCILTAWHMLRGDEAAVAASPAQGQPSDKAVSGRLTVQQYTG